MSPKRRTAAVTAITGVLLSSCIVFTVGGEQEPPERTPTSGPTETPSFGGGSFSVTGSGRVETEEREVAGFDRIRINGAAQVFIEQAGEESLTIEAEDNLLPLLTSDIDGGRLSLGVRANTTISTTKPIIFRLKVKSVKEVQASGAGRVEATGIDVPELSVGLSGAVSSVFTGTAETQEVRISGTGKFDGRGLEGRRASVTVSGAGEAAVNAAERVTAQVSGTGVVRYLGNPEVDEQTSGLGRVEGAQ